MLRLGSLALRDISANTAVTHEAAVFIERRNAGNGYIPLAAVRRRTGQLKIPERKVRVDHGPVLAPSLLVRLYVRDLPARLTDFGSRYGRVQLFGKFLTG